jgi:hypothetical protein
MLFVVVFYFSPALAGQERVEPENPFKGMTQYR